VAPLSRNPERGGVVLIVAVMLPLMMAMLFVAIDFGHYYAIRLQIQNGVDAAARAGAETLDGTPPGAVAAPIAARSMAGKNTTDLGDIGLNQEDVNAGWWDPAAKQFYPIGSTIKIGDGFINISPWTPQFINAVKVYTRYDGVGSHGESQKMAIPIYLHELKPTATAVAVAGGSCQQQGCMLPIVVPSCGLVDNQGVTVCGTRQTMYFNHGTGRDIVLANIVNPGSNVNNNVLRQQMGDGAACKLAQVDAGDPVSLGNGTDFNNQLASLVSGVVCTAAAPYDGCSKFSLAVSNNGNCAAPMNTASTTIGFVRVVILGVNPSGNDAGVTVYIDCDDSKDPPTRRGCANFGIGSHHAGLAL
jgi:hypothetical protein